MRRWLVLSSFGLGFPALLWLAWPGPGLGPAADRQLRAIEPRLTDAASYAPCEARAAPDSQRVISRAGCAGFPEPSIPERREIVEESPEGEEGASRGLDIEEIQRGALAHLAEPRGLKSIESAVRGLERAVRADPENARSWADLAAARFVLAQLLDEPSELIRALSAAQKAAQLDPSLPEARFNRALVLNLLPLRDQAIAAWRDYLEVDASSGWAQEAREHLALLEQPPVPTLWDSRLPALREAVLRNDKAAVEKIVAISPQTAREYAQEHLLGRWGEQVLAGQDSGEPLQMARAIGDALTASGDLSVALAVRAIDERAARPDALSMLARGHVAYRDASRELRNLFVERSAPLWREARDSLDRAGSPMVLWADLGAAGVDIYQSRPEEAWQRLQSISKQAGESGQLSLGGRARGALGLIRIRQGRFSESLSHYRAAARLFEQAGELENLGMMHGMIAENLRFLGQDAASWRSRYRAISLLSRYPRSMRLHNALWEGGLAALEDGEPEAALLLQNEGLRVAERTKDPGMIAEALLHRSKIQQVLGHAEAALEDLEQARRLNAQFEDQDIREKLDADIGLAEGKFQSATDPRQALVSYSEALDFYERRKLSLELIDGHLSRARAHLAQGDEQAGEADLAAALEVFERQRSSVTADDSRLSYSETVQELFDEMISLQARRGRPEEALSLSDRARSVPLVRQASEGHLGLSPDQIRQVPDGVVFVEYAMMRDRLMIWVVRRGHVGSTNRSFPPGELEKRVEGFLLSLRRNDPVPKIEELSAALHDLLIPEEVRGLPESVELCFIPDKILNAVPFAALRDRRQSRYLVEKNPVAIAPSIAFYLDTSGRKRSRPAETAPSALLIGATVFDQSLGLRRLPGAETEIVEIQSIYRDAVVISGDDATRARILDAIGDQEVLQFSGHGIYNARNPDHSYLAVAPAQEPAADTGMLFAHEIAGRNLGNLRLVVLSACDSLGPRNSRAGGLSGIARPFLDAGVPAVLGTLWDANDRASAALVPEFHRRFIQTSGASTSLREAQLKMLKDQNEDLRSPSSWGVFSLVGETR